MATLAQNLVDAEVALHALLTGSRVAEFRDSNGEFVRYTSASLADLRAYITDLKSQIAAEAGTVIPRGPMRIFF